MGPGASAWRRTASSAARFACTSERMAMRIYAESIAGAHLACGLISGCYNLARETASLSKAVTRAHIGKGDRAMAKKNRKPTGRQEAETPQGGPPTPKPLSAPPGGPYLQMAFFCEKILTEAGGGTAF